jgi:hypothetical protein
MAIKPLARKLLKIAGIVMGILLVLVAVAYVWLVHHAETILRDIVRSKSNGTVELSVKSVTYNFDKRRLNLKEAVIYNTDSATQKTAYRISVSRISLQLHALAPLIFRRELVIDSLLINNPDIRVMKSDTLEKKRGSLSHEIGDLYHSINKALSLFSIGHFRIENGRFSLNNQARADWVPVTISNIHFHSNNIQVGGNKKDTSAFHFSEDIVFNTDHQDITFPDGRYRMTFSNFRINVKDRVIVLDSCSILSVGKRQKNVAISLFFDKLKFSNIDFPLLYEKNIIRADSMYAINPKLHLKVMVEKTRRNNAQPVRIDTLLRHLGINTYLHYMGVKNISTTVETIQNGGSAEFHTQGDDFEMRDLVIDHTAPDPVSVGRFDMAIRGYSSFNKDSTYKFTFDSIRIINSRILLNNFSIKSMPKAPIQRHHQLPLFELDSLSWEDLIFSRRIKAKQAVLHHPQIHYVKRSGALPGKKFSLYSILDSLDNVMSLERIRVIDGEVSFEPNPHTRLLLEQVSLTVNTNQLLAARSSIMVGDAVDSLQFEKGSIKTKKLQAMISHGSFRGNGTQLTAADATIHDYAGKMTIKVQGLQMAGLSFDDSSDHIGIDQASWKAATITIKEQPKQPTNPSARPLSFHVQQVQGKNTQLSVTAPHSTAHTFINSLAIQDAKKENDQPLSLTGVAIDGKYLQYTGNNLTLNTGSFVLAEDAPSRLHNVRFAQYKTHDSITAAIPELRLVADLAALVEGNLQAKEIMLKEPTFLVKLGNKQAGHSLANTPAANPLPPIDIQTLSIEQPTLHLEQQQEKDTIRLHWNRGAQLANNHWIFTNIRHQGKEPLTIEKASLLGTAVSFTRQSEKLLLLQPQSIQLVLIKTRLSLDKPHNTPWSTIVEKLALKEMQLNHIGKDSDRLHLASLTLEQLIVQAKQSAREWLNNSPGFILHDLSGNYTTTQNDVRWKRLSYHHRQHLLSLDSFTYTPVATRDEYIAAHPYQTDYIQLNTGRITIRRPDLDSYWNDTLIRIGALSVYEPNINVYRDKRPSREPNVIRSLPVDMIKRLPIKITVDSVVVHNGQVQYEELSEKTNQSGVINISRLQAVLSNIKSRNLRENDSLKLRADAYMIDSIHVKLQLHESYTDSLAAFLMTTQVGPANLMILNKVVEPLASVRIRSGYLDTLTLRAVGREYLSYGEMQMLYSKLNVEILQAGKLKKKGFMTKVITFIANTFVIKSRNTHKTGIIYFERLRDRSIFNYMIKMLLSGAGSSVGAKSNKKYIKHYKRELRKQGLPPIEL